MPFLFLQFQNENGLPEEAIPAFDRSLTPRPLRELSTQISSYLMKVLRLIDGFKKPVP